MLRKIILKIKDKIDFENINKVIFFASIIIIAIGFFSFFSASIGFLNKMENEQFFVSFIKMQMISYIIGFILLIVFYFINIKILSRFAYYIYGLSIALGLLIFVPGLEMAHGGGVRWLNLFGFSLQPADIIKFASIIIFATYLSKYKKVLGTIKYGVIIPGIILLPVIIVFFLQRDLGTLAIIFAIVGGMYFLNKTKILYIVSAILAGLIIVASYAMLNSYVKDRFIGLKEESYQTKQSLIALGSGGLTGRGYGQSVQKFFHLPEPAGDSIYAVVGEEMGFMGTSFIAILFFVLIVSSYFAAKDIDNAFARNMIYGIIILYFAQFIMNTGSMTKIIPLSGDTLPFFSKGGSAIIMNLIELGILLKLTKRNN